MFQPLEHIYHGKIAHEKKHLVFMCPFLVGLLVKCSSQYFKADSNSSRKVMLKGYVFLRLCGGNSKYTSTFRTATS